MIGARIIETGAGLAFAVFLEGRWGATTMAGSSVSSLGDGGRAAVPGVFRGRNRGGLMWVLNDREGSSADISGIEACGDAICSVLLIVIR